MGLSTILLMPWLELISVALDLVITLNSEENPLVLNDTHHIFVDNKTDLDNPMLRNMNDFEIPVHSFIWLFITIPGTPP